MNNNYICFLFFGQSFIFLWPFIKFLHTEHLGCALSVDLLRLFAAFSCARTTETGAQKCTWIIIGLILNYTFSKQCEIY